MDKKKILYIITKANLGGAQRYVYDLATHLSKSKYDVAVAYGEDGLLRKKLEDKNIRTIAVSGMRRDINFLGEIRTFINLLHLIKKERPKILHVNSSKAAFWGMLAGRIAKVPKIIFTGHGWAFNEERNLLSKWILRKIHEATIKGVHNTIAVSNKTKEQIARTERIAEKISVVYNGITSEELKEKGLARTELLGLVYKNRGTHTPDAFLIGIVAELHKNKGIAYAIETAHKLKKQLDRPVFFLVFGEGEERERLEDLISEKELANEVFLLGAKHDVSKYMTGFDMFLLPSITEAMPYVILEAGQAGLPVAASAVGGVPEIIDDMDNGILLKPRESDDIVAAISYAIKNEEKMIQMAEKLKNKISDKFSLERTISYTMEIYESDIK